MNRRPFNISFEVILFFGLFLINILVSQVFTPYAYRDEAMYILNATALTGNQNNFSNPYGIGYSLLLAPFLLGDIFNPFQASILLNSIFFVGILLASKEIVQTEKFSAVDAKQLGLIYLIVSLYPAISLYMRHAMPEIALMLIIMSQYLLLGKYQAGKNITYLVIYVCISAFAFSLHPRMIGLPISAITILILVASFEKVKWTYIIGLLALLFVIIFGSMHVKTYVDHIQLNEFSSELDGLYQSQLAQILADLYESPIKLFIGFASACAGQLLYIYIATFGFMVLAISNAIKIPIYQWRNKRIVDLKNLNLLATFLIVLITASAQKSLATLPDQFIFGRYVDPFTPLLLLLSIKYIYNKNISRKNFYDVVLFGVLLLGITYFRAESIFLAESMRHRFWTIPGVNHLFQLFSGVFVIKFFFASVFIQIVFYLILKKLGRIAFLGAMAIFFLIQTTLILINSYNSFVVPRESARAELIEKLRTLKNFDGKCIGYDIEHGFHFLLWDYGVMFYERELKFFKSSNPMSIPCEFIFSKHSSLTEVFPSLYISKFAVGAGQPIYMYQVQKQQVDDQ
jgi:hypothetical protein